MSPYNFRSFIDLLESRNELVRIRREVDPKYEIPAILWTLEKYGKAAIFEKVKGKNIPIVGGLFQNITRLGLALDFHKEKFSSDNFFEIIHSAISKPVPYIEGDSSPVKEVVKKKTSIDLTELPVPTFFECDGGPYITAGVGIARNPETDTINIGVYRMQVIGKNKITIYASPGGNLRRIFTISEEKGGELEMVIAIGVDPAILIAAVSKTPIHISEFDVAGALKGKAIKVVKCETVDLLAPADAEILIEGRLDLRSKFSEGPIGEISGYYTTSISPIMNVTAICHRKNPLFHVILPGPSREHFTLIFTISVMWRQMILNQLKSKFKNIRDINLAWTPYTGAMMRLIISIDKKNEEEPSKIIREAFKINVETMPISKFIKQIVVVDEDVDIYDLEDIEWTISNRLPDESRVIIIPNVSSWSLERVVKPNGNSVRLGIDATRPLKEVKKLKRAKIPGLEKLKLKDYLQN